MSVELKGTHQKLAGIVGRDIPYIPCQAHRCNTAIVEHGCNASFISVFLCVFLILSFLMLFHLFFLDFMIFPVK